jgi:hypothetical protein
MAQKTISGIPDYKTKQKILYVEETPPEQLWQIAELLIKDERFSEAYDFIERMNDEEKLRWFLEESRKKGDFFNFDRAARRLDLEVPAKDWEELGDTAARLGLIKYAVECYRRAGNREKSKKIIEENPDFFGPILEMERFGAPKLSEQIEEEDEEEEDDLPQTLKAIEEGTLVEGAPKMPTKDPEQAARDAATKARKKKWKKRK